MTKRRWLLLGLLLLVMVGAAGGAYYVVKRGRKRAGLYDKAVAAFRNENYTRAETLLKTLLQSNEDNANARQLLIQCYLQMRPRRIEEAEAEARRFVENEETELLGWKNLIEIAANTLRFGEAERMARRIADRDPVYALTTIAHVRDTIGDRHQAVSTALSAATVTESDFHKASLYLFAADTLLDMKDAMPEGERVRVEAMGRKYLAKAQDTLVSASQTEAGPYELLRGRIQVLSELPEVRAAGRESLEFALGNMPENPKDPAAAYRPAVLASLAHLYVEEGNPEKALPLIEELSKRSYQAWLRAVRKLAIKGHGEAALQMLEQPPIEGDPAVELLRAKLLLDRKDQESKDEALSILQALSEREDIGARAAVQAYALLVSAGEASRGLEILEGRAERESDPRLGALVAAVLSASESRHERGVALAGELASDVKSLQEGLQVMQVLRRGGPDAVESYLTKMIEAGGEVGARHQLLRALMYAGEYVRDPESPEGQGRKATIDRDLAELERATLSKAELVTLWKVAVAVQDLETAGRILGRAIAIEEAPHNLALVSLQLAAGTEDDQRRADYAKGLREAVSEDGPRSFLALVADEIEKRPSDFAPVLAALEKRDGDAASLVPSLHLEMQLSLAKGDVERATDCARALNEARPDSDECRALYGDALLRKGANEEVLKLHEGRSSAAGASQCAQALARLGRRTDAIETLRAALSEYVGYAPLYTQLARLHAEEERIDEALGTLSVAPPTRETVLLRASLLLAQKHTDVAQLLFLSVLRSRPFDIEAWRGLVATYNTELQFDDLVQLLTGFLGDKDKLPPKHALRAELLAQRGTAYEQLARYRDALADYEASLAIQPRQLMALNNAAWIILLHVPERLDEGKAYIDRALEIAPDLPAVHDTAALIALERGEASGALDHIDRALAGLSKPSYMLNRARILVRLERKSEAIEQLRKLLNESEPDARIAESASKLLADLVEETTPPVEGD